MATTLYVCTTCRAGEPEEPGQLRPGARLHAALASLPPPANVRIVPVECLSACTRGAAISLTAPGRWSYVYGDLREGDVLAILDGARRYEATTDGLVPWRERPEIFRKHSIARIPPMPPEVPDPGSQEDAAP